MSRIYVCEYENEEITLKRIFNEDNEDAANKYAQKLAGGLRPNILTTSIRDGQKIYNIISFAESESKGVFCIKNNKMLTLKRNDIIESLKQTLPEEVKKYLTNLTKCKLSSEPNSKQESFIKTLLFY